MISNRHGGTAPTVTAGYNIHQNYKNNTVKRTQHAAVVNYYAKPYHPTIANEIALRRDTNTQHNILFLAGYDCVDDFHAAWPDYPCHSNSEQLYCEFDHYLQPDLYAWPSHGIDVAILTGTVTGVIECSLKNAVLDGYLANSVQTYQFEQGQWHGPVWFSPITALKVAA